MRLPACIVAALLLVATGTHAAEPPATSPQARVRVAFDRDGITAKVVARLAARIARVC